MAKSEFTVPDWFKMTGKSAICNKGFKRCFDIIFSSTALICLIPFFLLISFYILISSGPPLLFLQQRVGKNGKIFKMYKFRTMIKGATEDLVCEADDPRVTKVGHLLRRCKLDELPQFINVLKGEMSVVGPRPYIIWVCNDLKDNFPNYYRERLVVRPGISSLTHILIGGRRNSYQDNKTKLQLDIFYLNNFSFRNDLCIVLKTLTIMFKKEEF